MTVRDWAEIVVVRGIVPALLVVGVLAAGVSAGQVYPQARSAAYGGFWVGVLGFVALVLGLTDVTLGDAPEVGWLPPGWHPAVLTVVGVFIGGWTTWFYLRLRHRKGVAAPLAFQAFGALALLYLYAVWWPVREDIGWLAVGTAAASSVFYALGRDLPPIDKRSRTARFWRDLRSRISDRWYHARPKRSPSPAAPPTLESTPETPRPPRLGTRTRRLKPQDRSS